MFNKVPNKKRKGKMTIKKHCLNCRYFNSPYNTNYKCVPCKRGKYIKDNWKGKKVTKENGI